MQTALSFSSRPTAVRRVIPDDLGSKVWTDSADEGVVVTGHAHCRATRRIFLRALRSRGLSIFMVLGSSSLLRGAVPKNSGWGDVVTEREPHLPILVELTTGRGEYLAPPHTIQ